MSSPGTGGSPSDQDLIEGDIETYLARHEQKELVRFVAVGSVDDGKSTLIGRLLHDTQGIYEDQLAAVRKASRPGGSGAGTGEDSDIDFSLFTDGLRAEREQGITIDVAYRYFSTERRKFIIADTPGHVQYTRNMATGASTADVAIILLDARLGVLPQSRRHAYIASLLGIRHLLVAVNKMDLVDYAGKVFERLRADFSSFVQSVHGVHSASGLGFESVQFVPISARRGDNVVAPSARTPWYGGQTVLGFLEQVEVARRTGAEPLRFPVQYVIRPHLDYRGFAGQIAAGVLRAGEEVVVLPSGRRTRVRGIDTFEGPLTEAPAPLSVTVRLADEVDVSRGDMLVRPGEVPRVERHFDAMLVWLSERAFDHAAQRALLCKHTTRVVPARIERVQWRMDLEALRPVGARGLHLNDIARVTLRTNRPLFCDAYRDSHGTGAFILVDALGNDTVAAGMILPRDAQAAEGGGREGDRVTAGEREARLGQRGAALWLPAGAAASGTAIERALFDRGVGALVIEAATLSEEALVEVVARCVEAGLALVVSGATAEVRAAVDARIGSERSVEAAVDAGVVAVAQALADRCALPDE